MINLLLDLVPTTVDIDGKDYEINSNFRNGILFEVMMQDHELTDVDKIIQALDLYYPVLPNNIPEAIEKMLWFYRCGYDINELNRRGAGSGKKDQVYSFEFDADYIYAAFLDQYNIDLQDIEYLHWWKFKAMFKSLKEDNEFVKIMGYRSMDLSKVEDKKMKEHYRKLKRMYKIPEQISDSEKEKMDKLNEILLNGGDIKEVL